MMVVILGFINAAKRKLRYRVLLSTRKDGSKKHDVSVNEETDESVLVANVC